MTEVLLVALAACFFVSGIEEIITPLGRWRGLAAIILSLPLLFLNDSILESIVSIFASSFLVLVIISYTQSGVISESMARRLPRRVPPL